MPFAKQTNKQIYFSMISLYYGIISDEKSPVFVYLFILHATYSCRFWATKNQDQHEIKATPSKRIHLPIGPLLRFHQMTIVYK